MTNKDEKTSGLIKMSFVTFFFTLMGATKSDTLEHFKTLADTVFHITLFLNVTQAYRHHSQCLALSSRGGKHGAGGRRPHITTDAGN